MFLVLLALASAEPEADDDVTDLDAEEGHLPDGAVAGVMAKNESSVMDCSRRFGTRATHGRIEFSWQIELDGTVSHLKLVESALKNPLLEECLTGAVQKLQFPKPRGGTVHASHAFSF